VQYRGEIMPLVRVSQILGLPQAASVDGRTRVVVYHHKGTRVGLVVERILDTIEETISLQKSTNRPGILGSAVVRKRVTDFLDVEVLLERSEVVCFERTEA
jgi:two-component system chemotaxis sensor kinase CheA